VKPSGVRHQPSYLQCFYTTFHNVSGGLPEQDADEIRLTLIFTQATRFSMTRFFMHANVIFTYTTLTLTHARIPCNAGIAKDALAHKYIHEMIPPNQKQFIFWEKNQVLGGRNVETNTF
jgi:hypothetical protein